MKKVFLSSTVHDLRDIRDIIQSNLGQQYAVLASDAGTIPTDSSKNSYDICLDAAKECDFLIAIIDGRFGGLMPDGIRSITQGEIETALDNDKQVYVFVRQDVWNACLIYRTYKKAGLPFAPSPIVTDERVLTLIDSIRTRPRGNWIFQFNGPSDLIVTINKQLEAAQKQSTLPQVIPNLYLGGFHLSDLLLQKIAAKGTQGGSRYSLVHTEIKTSLGGVESNAGIRELASNTFERLINNGPEDRPPLHDSRNAFCIAHELFYRYAHFGQKARKRKKLAIPSYFNRVYPNTVNTFLKDMIYEPPALGLNADIAEACRFIINNTDLTPGSFSNRITHAAYLLGRIDRTEPNSDSKKTLYALQNSVHKRLGLVANNAGHKAKPEDIRRLHLLGRTAILSLAMLGERDVIVPYLDKLLNDPIEDDVNCGFHLEYYGDQPFDERLPLCSRDKKGSCANTLHYISHSIQECLDKPPTQQDNPLLLIEIQTFASIVARRLSGHREMLINGALPLLQRVSKLIEHEDLRAYIELVNEAAASDVMFARREIGRFFAAKNTPRTGWVDRKVRFPETVGAHTASSIWICNLIPDDFKESLDCMRIKQMLEIHDLAEGITGDIVTPHKRPEQEQVEKELMRRLSWLGVFDSSCLNLSEIYQCYCEFQKGETKESRIARDIDKLDIVLQGIAYIMTGADFNRSEVSALVRDQRPSTDEGKAVLRIVTDMQALSFESLSQCQHSEYAQYWSYNNPQYPRQKLLFTSTPPQAPRHVTTAT
jgi:5'-deoxynucleotidase YfbR-like HD superfamily hydrolase